MATPAQLFYSELIQNPNLNETEHWFPLPDELKLSKYLISNWGNVQRKDTKYMVTGHARPSGYKCANLSHDNGVMQGYLIHRLVAATFINNSEKKPTVDHVDRNPSNNNVLNLRWATSAEQNKNQRPRVVWNNKASVVQYDLNTGNTIKVWEGVKDAARSFGISYTNISHVCIGRQKSSQGFGWRYLSNIIPDEIWQPIAGFSKILISNMGRLKRINGKFLAGSKHSGYVVTKLRDDTKNNVPLFIHRIVCATFNGPAPEGKNLVNHKDGNKSNNCFSNLEWCTASENVQHAHDNGLINMTNAHKKRMKAVIQYDAQMNELARFDSITEAKKQVHALNINRACIKHLTAGGFYWAYAN